jgi:phage terminase large subunit
MGWVGFTIYKILEVELGIILSSNLIQLNPWTPLVIIEFNLSVFLCIISRKDQEVYSSISMLWVFNKVGTL